MSNKIIIFLALLLTSCTQFIVPEKIEIIIKHEKQKEYSEYDLILPYIKPDTIKHNWWELPDSMRITPCIYIDTGLK